MSTHVVWFRRDLRLRDLPALATACREADAVVPLFVFDPALLHGRFPSPNRVQWMVDALAALDAGLRERGGRLVVRHGDPVEEVRAVAREAGASVVHVSDDVTGFARRRDERVERALAVDGVELHRHPGLWIGDLGSLLTGQGRPYSVFSPFFRSWKAQARRPVERRPRAVPTPEGLDAGRLPTLRDLGWDRDPPALVDRPVPGEAAGLRAARRWIDASLARYAETRNTLSVDSSRLSVYLHYGCVSPLWLETQVLDEDETFRGELAWRDFYAAVQLHFPWTARTEFQERYRGTLAWEHDEAKIAAWKEGRTGFPVVDAGMRQLKAMGWMHNRARMVVGSFLTKDLHVDWRVGEAHFMEHLLDGDQASNNGGWQWVASTGADPAPYFQRLFNPWTQAEKFDPDGAYVRRWVPEHGTDAYPEPIVDHAVERRRAIERYRAAGA